MKPAVMLFMKADFAWDQFAKALTDAAGINPFAQGVSVSRETAFLAALDCLDNGRASVWNAVKRSTDSLSHIPLGFFILCDDEAAFAIMRTKIHATRLKPNILIATAGLDIWRDFVIRFASNESTDDLRFIADCVYLILQQMKLDDLFAGYKRKPLADDTFILEKR